jgi:hypothetical protein
MVAFLSVSPGWQNWFTGLNPATTSIKVVASNFRTVSFASTSFFTFFFMDVS